MDTDIGSGGSMAGKLLAEKSEVEKKRRNWQEN
jgi:hypothetical protein